MKSLNEVNHAGLRWVQTAKLESQLVTGNDESVGNLVWKNSWGSLATGESADGRWTLKRLGFVRPKITIRKAGSDSNVGVVSMNSGVEGTLHLAGGELYRFNLSDDLITVIDSQGRKVMMLKRSPSKKKNEEASLEITTGASEHLSLLAIIGWYLVLLVSHYDDYDASYIGALTAIMGSSV
jgi:hypothetical protein